MLHATLGRSVHSRPHEKVCCNAVFLSVLKPMRCTQIRMCQLPQEE